MLSKIQKKMIEELLESGNFSVQQIFNQFKPTKEEELKILKKIVKEEFGNNTYDNYEEELNR